MKKIETIREETVVYELVTHERVFAINHTFRLRLTQTLDTRYNVGHYDYFIELVMGDNTAIVHSSTSTGGQPDEIGDEFLEKLIQEFKSNQAGKDIKYAQ